MRTTPRLLVALLLTFSVIAAACGDDSEADTSAADGTSVPGETTATDPGPDGSDGSDGSETDDSAPDDAGTDDVELTASARGITEDTIHIGMAIADVTSFSNTGDQNARFQEIADEINRNGGIIGRQLELHFAQWDLLDTSGFDAACVQLTQDTEVFAVIARVPANFGEMTCFTSLNDHIVVNALDLNQSEIDDSDGKLFSILSDQHTALLGGLEALAPELADAHVAITAEVEGGEEQAEQVADRLAELGVDVVETTLATIQYSDDPTAALAEQNRFAERWKVAGATHVIGIGNGIVGAAEALVDTGAADDIVLISPTINVRVLTSLNTDLSKLDMIGVAAPDLPAVAAQGINGTAECISLIEDAGLGPVIVVPEEEELNALPSTLGACATFDFLAAILEAAGPNPSRDDVLAVTESGLSFTMTTAGSASVGAGKGYLNDDPGLIHKWDPAALTFTPR